MINILNPKLALFLFAFLPLFVSTDRGSPERQMLALSAFFMGLTFAVLAIYGILASGISLYLINSPIAVRRTQRSFALIFALLAVQLALTKR